MARPVKSPKTWHCVSVATLPEAEEAVAILRLEKNRATSLIEEFMVAANGK